MRGFRERYGSLAGAATSGATCEHHAPDWPLPDGARHTDTPDGPCVVHDRVYGGEPIAEARMALARCLDARRDGALDPADVIFLDTETTGLSGGTGTHVFLVGVGRFTGDALHVRQFFMRHPGDERSLLSALASDLRHAGALVTYNGKAFDVPLLDTRYRMHGRAFNRPEQHVDLLASARAIWKHRLPNCSLGTIERMVLGVERELDAPGWLIPQLYFDYLRSRRIETLEPVFEHNRTDIVTLARLTGIVHSFEAGLTIPGDEIDCLALALHRLRRHGSDESLADIRARWSVYTVPSALRLRALKELSTALKRRRRHTEAAVEWTRALADPSRPIRLFAAEELAKYFEHRERDPGRAREIARRAADGAALAGDEDATASFERRLVRLERKLLAAQLATAVTAE